MKKFTLLLLLAFAFIQAQTPCVNGFVTVGGKSYPCNGLTLQSYISAATMGAAEGQDSWGWTDPQDGKEYAIVALDNGTAFVNITNPTNPKYLGRLNTHTGSALWRDVKVYKNYAYVVSDGNGNHGMQIFDLTRLRGLTGNPVQNFSENGWITWGTTNANRGRAHNIVINKDSGYAYILGVAPYNSGGPLIVKLDGNNNGVPNDPIIVKAFSALGYCHDAQVVMYDGPDPDYQGHEIMMGAFSSDKKINIIDVSDKNNPILISSLTYLNKYYTHQGWFTEDKRFFIAGDEVDEENIGFNTRTMVFDLNDLDNPYLYYTYYGATKAIDHNGYVRGNRFYLANYAAGARIIKIDGLYNATPSMTEVSSFDCFPPNNIAAFNGTWNVYPFFESGNLLATGFGDENVNGDGGLFILKDPNYDNVNPVARCKNFIAILDSSGSVTVTATDLDNGSTDNKGIVKRTLTGQTTFNCSEIGSHDITLTVEDDYGNKDSCTSTVTVGPKLTTYTAGNWTAGSPDPGSLARINDDYDTAIKGSFTACICEINAAKTLTVAGGDYIEINRDIKVTGNLVVAHEGSVVQLDPAAFVINNGNIKVQKTTPTLAERDFMILGSPMTAETRAGVYGSALMVRNHITSNFIPNQAVALQFPLAENFADDNGNNWVNYSGNIDPGEGYLVRPQTASNPTGIFDLEYTLGTLNNGDVPFNVIYNGTTNSSPNVLGNPYPSAIDANIFLSENDMIDAVYFWEHLTAPSVSYPGYNQNNYNMGDLSIYNSLGGIPPANGGPGFPAPNGYIASGQGFAVKVTASGTALFLNTMRVRDQNDTYRQSNGDSDKIWLSVRTLDYQLGSTALIGFVNGATTEMDREFDSKRLATPVSIFSQTKENQELAIQGLPPFSGEEKVFLGFSSQITEKTKYTISIANIAGPYLESASIYLYDTLTNVTENLSKGAYSFYADAGNYPNRFILTIEKGKTSDQGEGDVGKVVLYPNPNSGHLNLKSLNAPILGVTIFDIQGRKVLDKQWSAGMTQELDISTLKAAMYFVKIDTARGNVMERLLKK